MQPEHANNLGNVHGGWIMKLVDDAGALACMRHAQRRVVTVAIDSMVFTHPIRLGDLVLLTADGTRGKDIMVVEIQWWRRIRSRRALRTNTAYAV
jgi:acyl-CoA hydrolase